MNEILPCKKCKKCQKDKAHSDFYKATHHKDGLSSLCKICTNKKNKEWASQNKSKVRGYIKKWTLNNIEKVKQVIKKYKAVKKEVIKQKSKEYKKKNSEKIKQYQKSHYEKNKERKLRLGMEYRRNNPDKNAEYSRNRRAKKSGNGGKITKDEWNKLLDFYGNKCLCCGSKDKLTMDHILPLVSGGKHTIDNVQPLCSSCNSSKGARYIDYRHK